MNRTVVDFVPAQTVACAKPPDFILDAPLLRLEPGEFGLPLRKRIQILSNEGTYGLAELCGPNPRCAVDVVGNRDGNILHNFTVPQLL